MTSSNFVNIRLLDEVTYSRQTLESEVFPVENLCPICAKKAKAFFCTECIQHGNFYHSQIKLHRNR